MGENREYLTQSASDGSINISEDVVVAIASEAIGEIEGVGAMMTTMTEQLTEQFMGKKPHAASAWTFRTARSRWTFT